MILTYDIINKNLETYNKFSSLSIFRKFLNKEVTSNTIRDVGLSDVLDFNSFIENLQLIKICPTTYLKWPELKKVLSENAGSERFEKYIGRRTEKEFIEILKDCDKFDRLLNGRWISKPIEKRNGRSTSGRRSDDRIVSFATHLTLILNYVIQNKIEISWKYAEKPGYYYFRKIKYFIDEIKIENRDKVYDKLSNNSDDVLMDEISDLLDNTKIDLSRVNINTIMDYFKSTLTSSISIKPGSVLVSLVDFKPLIASGSANVTNGVSHLTKGKKYKCISSTIFNGLLRVCITNDTNSTEWYQYSDFEDLSKKRDNTINNLLKSISDDL